MFCAYTMPRYQVSNRTIGPLVCFNETDGTDQLRIYFCF